MNRPGPFSKAGAPGHHEQADPAHASYVFLLDETGAIHPLPHALYVALARERAGSDIFANRRLRLADWYVRLSDGVPEQVINEWYGWVSFDSQGRFDPAPDLPQRPPSPPSLAATDESALPTSEERQRMAALLFGRARDQASMSCPLARAEDKRSHEAHPLSSAPYRSRSARIGHSGRWSPWQLDASCCSVCFMAVISAMRRSRSATCSSAIRLTEVLLRRRFCQSLSNSAISAMPKPRSRARRMKRSMCTSFWPYWR